GTPSGARSSRRRTGTPRCWPAARRTSPTASWTSSGPRACSSKGVTMANDILVLADHLGGQLSDTTLELVGKARELAGATGGQVMVALLGARDVAGRIAGVDASLSAAAPALV